TALPSPGWIATIKRHQPDFLSYRKAVATICF
ncbi:MAG: hypothetical protein ACI8QF_004735, partial [Limisphaerales bacterium]